MPDAAEYHDEGSNTLLAASRSPYFPCQICAHWAILILTESILEKRSKSERCICQTDRGVQGKDTTIGHWEIAGVISSHPLPTFPMDFHWKLLKNLSRKPDAGYFATVHIPARMLSGIMEKSIWKLETDCIHISRFCFPGGSP